MKPTKLPSGNWRVQVCVGKDGNGKRHFESITRKTRKECIRDAVAIAEHFEQVSYDQSQMTLTEAIDAYIDLKSNILSPATIRGYRQIQRCYFEPEMSMRLSVISDLVAQRAVNREAGLLSPKTVANAFGLMSAVIRTFTKRQLSVTLPQKEEYDITILETDELRVLLKAIEGTSAELPILIALFLGLRRSEIMALKPEDFDQEHMVLRISKAKVYDTDNNIVEKRTKTTKSKRVLPVPKYLGDKMKVTSNFYPCHPNTPGKVLTRVCKENNLPHVRLHDLRHQNASVMLALGVADKYAMERGGWSSNKTLKNVYQHTFRSERQDVDNMVNNYFESLVM